MLGELVRHGRVRRAFDRYRCSADRIALVACSMLPGSTQESGVMIATIEAEQSVDKAGLAVGDIILCRWMVWL